MKLSPTVLPTAVWWSLQAQAPDGGADSGTASMRGLGDGEIVRIGGRKGCKACRQPYFHLLEKLV